MGLGRSQEEGGQGPVRGRWKGRVPEPIGTRGRQVPQSSGDPGGPEFTRDVSSVLLCKRGLNIKVSSESGSVVSDRVLGYRLDPGAKLPRRPSDHPWCSSVGSDPEEWSAPTSLYPVGRGRGGTLGCFWVPGCFRTPAGTWSQERRKNVPVFSSLLHHPSFDFPIRVGFSRSCVVPLSPFRLSGLGPLGRPRRVSRTVSTRTQVIPGLGLWVRRRLQVCRAEFYPV